MIARQLNEVGADVPERTVARRGAEWREEQERRERVRDQVQAMVGAMKDHDLSSAEMLQALAIDALMSDPEAWAQADPVKVQRQNLQAETLRLKAPQVYMMALGLLLILSVLYLPGGLASLRWETFRGWRDATRAWWKERSYEWSGDKARDKERARRNRYA